MAMSPREVPGFEHCVHSSHSIRLTGAIAALLATSALALSLMIAVAIVSFDVIKAVPISNLL
jgi:hypothetical protein